LILVGAILLLMPFAHNGHLSFINALFTSTSAVCVTGLIVKNTATAFTPMGQLIILILIQIGGLGYMTSATFIAVVRRQKIGYRDRLILKEALNYPGMDGLVRFLKIVFTTTFAIELIGAIILTLRFWMDMPFTKALWFGVFHAVSAFNNAGFSLFTNNFANYRGDLVVNFTVPVLIILGGLGYFVLIELYNLRKKRIASLSVHTKLVLIMTAVLILLGMALLLSLDWNNSFKSLSWPQKILAAWFTSVNYRTAGFNTIDLGSLTGSNMFFSTFFMMIGGAPGGTAGGIKITTVALALIGVWHTIRGETNAHIFHHSISSYQINKAYAIIFIATFYVVSSTIMLSEMEHLPFLRVLFETCSAFGTVGLSTGNGGALSYSANFNDFGKLNIIILMFIGRIGVFAFTAVIVGKTIKSRIKYAEGKIIL
jgi:trk system potassium uptake protein